MIYWENKAHEMELRKEEEQDAMREEEKNAQIAMKMYEYFQIICNTTGTLHYSIRVVCMCVRLYGSIWDIIGIFRIY